jgi:2-oxoglutarate dehydrogenase complex dehydrogenase (E1) component-like enzyme
MLFLYTLRVKTKSLSLQWWCYSYAGRPTAASPATGSKMQHYKEQGQLLEDALGM